MSPNTNAIDTAVDHVLDQPSVGTIWACVTAQGRGQPVRVLKTSPLSIEFRPIGRGHNEGPSTLPRDLFLARYSPLAEVEQRQQNLRQREQTGDTPVIDDSGKGLTPNLPPMYGKSKSSPVPAVRGPLTREVVREIFALAKANQGTHLEIATAYNVARSTVGDILVGRSYGAWTADLRQPAFATRGELTGEAARAIWLATRELNSITGDTDAELARQYNTRAHIIRDIRRSATYRWAYKDLIEANPALERAAIGQSGRATTTSARAKVPTTPQEDSSVLTNHSQERHTPSLVEPEPQKPRSTEPPLIERSIVVPAALMDDLLEALDVMLQYSDTPRSHSRYLRVNTKAIQQLLDRTRHLVSSHTK